MKTVFFLILFLYNLLSSAQKTEAYFDYNWEPTEDIGRARYYSLVEKKDSVWQRQDFFLREKKLQMTGTYLDKETKISHGAFQYYHSNGTLQSTGNYFKGKRNGLWLRFHENGMIQDSTVYSNGNISGISLRWHQNGYLSDSAIYQTDGSGLSISWFDNGNPSLAGIYVANRKEHGKWQYFHKNGKTSEIEIYNSGVLSLRQVYDEEGKSISDTSSKDQEASFPGGLKAWKKYLEKKLYFPSQYRISGSDQAVVVVDWAVNEEGNIVEVIVSGPLHPDFDKIAADAIRNSPKWIPAVSHHRKIKEYHRQAVTFVQE